MICTERFSTSILVKNRLWIDRVKNFSIFAK